MGAGKPVRLCLRGTNEFNQSFRRLFWLSHCRRSTWTWIPLRL